MPNEIYEIIALAARYWFLFLMILIAWRSYRWYARDRKKYKKRLKLLPDAGYIGELVVVQGDEIVRKGTCLPVNREGVLGYLRSNDVCVPMDGIANRHFWYTFDETDGLRVEPFRSRQIVADGQELIGKRMRTFLSHGSVLQVGQAKLRLRMFSGFEYAGKANVPRRPFDETDNSTISNEIEGSPHFDPVQRMHEIATWQTMMELEENEENEQEFYPSETDEDDDEDDDAYLPAMDETEYDAYEPQSDSPVFYLPVTDDGDNEIFPPMDNNCETAKSMYVDDDEAELAKRVLWDKYFKGGNSR